MKKINVRLHISDEEVEASRILDSVSSILDNNTIFSMSSINGNSSYINSAFFAYSTNLNLYFLTEETTQHAQNVLINSSVAVSLCNNAKLYGENLQGLQLFGTCKITPFLQTTEAITIYMQRFPLFRKIIKNPEDFITGILKSKLYRIEIHSIKLIDEPQFGRRRYIKAQVLR